jgi:hypothetical protein
VKWVRQREREREGEGEEKRERTRIQLNRRRVTRAPELKLLPISFSLSLSSSPSPLLLCSYYSELSRYTTLFPIIGFHFELLTPTSQGSDAGEDEGIGSAVAVLKRSGCRGVESILSQKRTRTYYSELSRYTTLFPIIGFHFELLTPTSQGSAFFFLVSRMQARTKE